MAEPTRHPVARDGKVIGHYHLEAIKVGLRGGQLRPSDHVWAEGQARWLTLEELGRLHPGLMPEPTEETAAAGGGFLAGVGSFLGAAFLGLATVMKWVVVITFGLFLGMIVQSGGRNPNRQGDNDPLRDPYAGGRDPDFDDPDREA